MNEPYRQRHIMQYTEMVYYDAGGNEVAREELYDTHLYDVLEPEFLTAQEMEDYGLGGDDE